MDKETRNRIQRATQAARALLEREYAEQLGGIFDIRLDGSIAAEPGSHLDAEDRVVRTKLVAAVDHRRASGLTPADAVAGYLREAAFTVLNRFVALKMLEARGLVQECVSRGDQSAGFKEFTGLAPGLVQVPDHGYRLYVESLFDEIGREVRVLFDRRDPAGLLWPRRLTLFDLLALLNASDLTEVWKEDETIGWVYQYFNGDEERKRMREESQAPRNSHELAVRNQFFTPRYVVQFLTENTLGRLWLEMHGDKTRLAERCVYLVRTRDEATQPRPKKDPRDLRILDPACGSGHFLLYSFDLLLVIYLEAWEDEESGRSHASGRTLREDYPDLAALHRAVPALIVEHNLYGVDIDPRCAQIAALALWLRAQRAWMGGGVPASERVRIRRTHIVVAEPMPGDATLVEEFATRLDPPLLRDLFRKMVGESRLAGELGTLLRMENGIATELHRARQQFVERQRELRKGYLPGLEPVRKQRELDLSGIDDDCFFHEAEERIVEVLRGFAESATGGASVRRRLFAGDAAQGIALIDLLRTHFDVVLMNPPFGDGSLGSKSEFEKSYPRTKNDIYAAFVERGLQLLHPQALLGAITSRTGFFLSSFQRWREEILLAEASPVVFADLGYGVLDGAMVEVAAYCLEKGRQGNRMKTVFVRALEADNKAAMLRTAIREPEVTRGKQRFEVDSRRFSAIKATPFAYWASDRVIDLFVRLPAIATAGRIARTTNPTTDDFRFARAWWEPAPGELGTRWRTWNKGGGFSPYYRDIDLVVDWDQARSTYRGYLGTIYRPDVRPANLDYFFQPGLTWVYRGHRLCVQAMPAGTAISTRGNGLYSEDALQMFDLGLLNSSIADSLIKLSLGRGGHPQFDIGDLSSVPVPPADAAVCRLARLGWSGKRRLDMRTETSHAFTLPALLQVAGETLASRATTWAERRRSIEAEFVAIQAEIDKLCFDLYGIDEADRRAIVDGSGGSAGAFDESVPANVGGDEGTDEEGEPEGDSDSSVIIAELVSWAVGVAFGRFDVRVATGGRALPQEPEPFDRLPVCSPAMLTGDDGLPLSSASAGYPHAFPENGILVDDPGHPRDLTAAVRAVFEIVFGERADAIWQEAAGRLDPKEHDLRVWLASSLFEHHRKRYSKSRRKAPIFWQLGVPSGRTSVWLYAQRLTRDSIFQLQNDFVAPKLAHEERQLTSLLQHAGGSSSAKERKEIDAQEAFVDELRGLLDEVKRVAPLWRPTLEDGVVLTMAPLWRLVPNHKAWQKELKSQWDEVCVGKYDWAQLAMHLWPERVVSKCAEDRSLAIAHGLEEVFWVEGADGKWQKRRVDQATIGRLVAERTSAGVKDALKSLINAPPPPAGRVGGRRTAAPVRAAGRRAGPEVAVSSPVDGAGGSCLERVRKAIASAADGASRADVVAATGITDAQWSDAISMLLSEKVVTKAGERRHARYHIVEKEHRS